MFHKKKAQTQKKQQQKNTEKGCTESKIKYDTFLRMEQTNKKKNAQQE